MVREKLNRFLKGAVYFWITKIPDSLCETTGDFCFLRRCIETEKSEEIIRDRALACQEATYWEAGVGYITDWDQVCSRAAPGDGQVGMVIKNALGFI